MHRRTDIVFLVVYYNFVLMFSHYFLIVAHETVRRYRILHMNFDKISIHTNFSGVNGGEEEVSEPFSGKCV